MSYTYSNCTELIGVSYLCYILQVTINSHVVELASVATDYKFQGRSERCIILSMMLPGCPRPRLDVHGLYVLLTRTTRRRDSMRLVLLSEGANTLQSLRYLLELKRPKDLIIFLRGSLVITSPIAMGFHGMETHGNPHIDSYHGFPRVSRYPW